MGSQTELTINIINKVLERKIKQSDARRILNCSESTIKRYTKGLKLEGASYFIHGNKGKSPINKINYLEKERIMKNMRDDFFDFNPTHALEEIKDQDKTIKVSIGTFRKWCKIEGFGKKRKNTKKIYQTREMSKQRGIMLQMDGSPHKWFGHKQSCLIAAIDDSTKEIPFGLFAPTETTIDCMKLLKKIVEIYGAFDVLYVDRAGIYGGNKRQNFAQFKAAAERLGIQVVYAYSPQAKGRIERLFRTLQSRLIPLMRKNNIYTFEAANKYFIEDFLPNHYNKNFTRPPKILESAFRPVAENVDLNEVFTLRESRTISGGHCIRIDGQRYLIETAYKEYLKGQEIEVRTYLDLTWKIFFRSQELKITPIDGYQRFLRLKYD